MAVAKYENVLHAFWLLETVCIKENKNLKIYTELTPVLKTLSKRNLAEGIKWEVKFINKRHFQTQKFSFLLRSVKQELNLATTAV